MNVREVAFQVLMDVYQRGTYSNLALNQALKTHSFILKDRFFLTRLVYGVIQNDIRLDYYINQILVQEKIRQNMRILLKMALYQKRFMDKVPLYAIMNETVEIAKKMDGVLVAKFANAILHKLLNSEFEVARSQFESELEYRSVFHSCPLWILRLIAKQYGEESAYQYVRYNQIPPPMSMRVNTMKTDPATLMKENPIFKPSLLTSSAVMYCGEQPILELKEFQQGVVSVQDESGQLVAQMLDPKPGEYILDMCAAPGSKTGHIAELMKNEGKIVAIDLHPHRISLLQETLKRLEITNTKPIPYDALKLKDLYKAETFDRVLVDAPCSGFGVIRRKPDIALRITPQALDELVVLQSKLLVEAVRVLKKGGTLVYSTCTLNRKENNAQIQHLCDNNPDLTLVSEQTIFPHQYQSDGFYIAKLTKG